MFSETAPTLTDGARTLRPLREDDAALIQEASRDLSVARMARVPLRCSREEALGHIARQRMLFQEGEGYPLAIHDDALGRAVGEIGLWRQDARAGVATIGYWIAPEFRQRGHARGALALISTWGLSLPGVSHLELLVEPANEGSWRAAEACGYQRLELLRGWLMVDAEKRDAWRYRLQREVR